MNSTPSGRIWQWRRSSFVSTETLSGQVKENNTASFHDNCLRESDLFLPRDARYVVTELTSKVWEYRGLGGRLLNIPLKELSHGILTYFEQRQNYF